MNKLKNAAASSWLICRDVAQLERTAVVMLAIEDRGDSISAYSMSTEVSSMSKADTRPIRTNVQKT